MSIRLLLADESSTIEKVVELAIEDKEMELTVSKSLDQLKKDLSEKKYDVLIYNLEFDTDHELSEVLESIKSSHPELKLVALLGTFSEVNDEELQNLGFITSVQKPIEPEDLINSINKANEDEKSFSKKPNFDGWVINESQSEEEINDKPEDTHNEQEDSNLEVFSELSSWQMSVPESSESKENVFKLMSKPDPLDLEENKIVQLERNNEEEKFEENESQTESQVSHDDSLYPDDDDLEFPEDKRDSIELPTENLDHIKLHSEKIPFEELDLKIDSMNDENVEKEEPEVKENVTSDIESDFDESTGSYEIGEETREFLVRIEDEDIEEVKRKEKQDPIFSDVLWSEDDIEVPSGDNLQKVLDESKIEAIFEKTIRRICEEKIDKIAWEVIPDLAESLISKEIKKIREEVLSDLN